MEEEQKQKLKKKIEQTLLKYQGGDDKSPSYGFDILRWAKAGKLTVDLTMFQEGFGNGTTPKISKEKPL
jgi:hypothetical protein